jgi:hypothetical protein
MAMRGNPPAKRGCEGVAFAAERDRLMPCRLPGAHRCNVRRSQRRTQSRLGYVAPCRGRAQGLALSPVGSDGRVPRRPVHRHGDIADCATVVGETDGMHNSYLNSYNATRCFIAPALQAKLRAWRMLAKASQRNAIAPTINLIRANWRDRDQLGFPERPIIAGHAASVVVHTSGKRGAPIVPSKPGVMARRFGADDKYREAGGADRVVARASPGRRNCRTDACSIRHASPD